MTVASFEIDSTELVIEDRIRALGISMDNAEHGQDFDMAEELGRKIDLLEANLDALFELNDILPSVQEVTREIPCG